MMARLVRRALWRAKVSKAVTVERRAEVSGASMIITPSAFSA